MTQRQLMIIRLLFATEPAHSKSCGVDGAEVLVDPSAEDISFMEQLIKEGSVSAYKGCRSVGCAIPCYKFFGFTPKGRDIYEPFVAVLTRNKNMTGTTKGKDAPDAKESTEA